MLAAIFEGPGRMEVREIDRPKCTPDGMIVRIEACAICGTDVRIYQHGQSNVLVPQVMGHETVGVVDEVGPDTVEFKVGDRVGIRGMPCGRCPSCQRGMQNFCTSPERKGFGYALPGGFEEYMHIPGQAMRVGSILRVPDGVDMDEVSIFEPLGCVVNGQEMVAPTVGETVVIIGAGPIGCMHLLLSKLQGASRTILVDLMASRLNLAKRFGANVYVDSSIEDPLARVREETGGAGADVVVVACSSGVAQQQALEMAGRGGRVSYFAGLPHNSPNITFNSNLLHYKQLTLYGVTGGNFRQHRLAFDLLATKRIDGSQLITHKVPLRNIMDGFKIVMEGQSLKTLIKPHMQ